MKRKVIALLVICVMVLSGCGKTTPEEKSEETVQDIQQKEIADDLQITLKRNASSATAELLFHF